MAAYSTKRNWDIQVQMPWQDDTLITYKDPESSVEVRIERCQLIKKRLRGYIPDVNILEEVIQSYTIRLNEDGTAESSTYPFRELRDFIDSMSDEAREDFFKEKNGVLPTIQALALNLENVLEEEIGWLEAGSNSSCHLHQQQAASILANAFLCTFPLRTKSYHPSINFIGLFCGRSGRTSHHIVEKLKCLVHYFTRIREKMPIGYISYKRKCTREDDYPRWNKVRTPLGNLTVDSKGKIEDQAGHLQADFANKFVGGGVLGWGCVQEEIRFTICPELIVARLFTEPLRDNETMLIIGAERFSNYTGYSDSFAFAGDFVDETPRDSRQRRETHVLVVDALRFPKPAEQYRERNLLRELKKMYTGLYHSKTEQVLPFATGNWGCGAFRGDPELKALLQLMVASQTGRDLVYFTFGSEEFEENLMNCYNKLLELSITVGQLYEILAKFARNRRSNQTVFEYVRSVAGQHAGIFAASAAAREAREQRWGDSAGPAGSSEYAYNPNRQPSHSRGEDRGSHDSLEAAGSSRSSSSDYKFFKSKANEAFKPKKPTILSKDSRRPGNAKRDYSSNPKWAMEGFLRKPGTSGSHVSANKFYSTTDSQDSIERRKANQTKPGVWLDETKEVLTESSIERQKKTKPKSDMPFAAFEDMVRKNDNFKMDTPPDTAGIHAPFKNISRTIVGSSPYQTKPRKDVCPLKRKGSTERKQRTFAEALKNEDEEIFVRKTSASAPASFCEQERAPEKVSTRKTSLQSNVFRGEAAPLKEVAERMEIEFSDEEATNGQAACYIPKKFQASKSNFKSDDEDSTSKPVNHVKDSNSHVGNLECSARVLTSNPKVPTEETSKDSLMSDDDDSPEPRIQRTTTSQKNMISDESGDELLSVVTAEPMAIDDVQTSLKFEASVEDSIRRPTETSRNSCPGKNSNAETSQIESREETSLSFLGTNTTYQNYSEDGSRSLEKKKITSTSLSSYVPASSGKSPELISDDSEEAFIDSTPTDQKNETISSHYNLPSRKQANKSGANSSLSTRKASSKKSSKDKLVQTKLDFPKR